MAVKIIPPVVTDESASAVTGVVPAVTPVVGKSDNTAAGMVSVALNRHQGIIFRLANGRRVEIAGNSAHLRGLEMGRLPVGGFGITRIPAADWKEILATYGEMEIFKNGLCFASDDESAVRLETLDRKGTRHGLEPVDPQATATSPTTSRA